jgi:hypothetical protein
MLLASGRVESSSTNRTASLRNWKQIGSAVVDDSGCQARVHYDFSYNGNDPTDKSASLFFEGIDTVEAIPEQEAEDQIRSRIGQPRWTTFSGSVYLMVINGWYSSLKAMHHAVELCGGGSKDPF